MKKQTKNNITIVGVLLIIFIMFIGYNIFYPKEKTTNIIKNKELSELEAFYQRSFGVSGLMSNYLVFDYDLKLKKDEELLVYAELYYGKEQKQFEYDGELQSFDYLNKEIRACYQMEDEDSNYCDKYRSKGIIILNVSPTSIGSNSFDVKFYVSDVTSIMFSPTVKINDSVSKNEWDGVSQIQDLQELILTDDLKLDKEVILGKIIYGQGDENIEVVVKAKLQKMPNFD